MQTTYFKITIYFRDGSAEEIIRRYFTTHREEIGAIALTNAQWKYGHQKIYKVDAWQLAETDPEVIEYKKKWL